MLSLLACLILFRVEAAGGSQSGVEPRSEQAAEISPDRAQLAAVAPTVKRATFLLGHAGGGHGTAFLISRQHRLLATAAHVADHVFENGGARAIPDGTATEYRVARVWYHPAIVRKLDEGLYARSDDPKDGEVAYRVPDVALIQLAEGGPELPEECALAADDELATLAGRVVGQLGYPGPLATGWPTAATPASVSLETGSRRIDPPVARGATLAPQASGILEPTRPP